MATEDKALVNQKLEAEIANLRAETAKTQAEPLKLPEVKTPEGTVDVSNANGLVGRLVAYRMLEAEAVEVVRLIRAHENQLSLDDEEAVEPLRVLLVGSPDLSAGEATYWTVHEEIRRERARIDSCHRRLLSFVEEYVPPEAVREEVALQRILPAGAALVTLGGPVAPAVAAAVGAASTLVGMLRTDYAVKGDSVTIGQEALIATIAGKILAEKWEALIDGFDLVSSGSEILGAFTELNNSGSALRRQLRRVRSLFTSHLDGTDDLPGPLSDLLAECDAALKQLEEFVGQVTAPPAAGGPSPLIAAARAGLLHAQGASAVDYVVYAGIEGGGQEAITKRGFNPFANRRVFHLGGVAAYHLIYDVKRRRTVAAGCDPLLGKVRFNLHSGELEGKVESIFFP